MMKESWVVTISETKKQKAIRKILPATRKAAANIETAALNIPSAGLSLKL